MVYMFICICDTRTLNFILKADIVRARVRTFGVEEHKFVMENGMEGVAYYFVTTLAWLMTISGAHAGSEWYIYDVGGSRSMVCLSDLLIFLWHWPYIAQQRQHWIPYFDDGALVA